MTGSISGLASKKRPRAQSDTYTSETSTGTSTSGPTTPARAWPDTGLGPRAAQVRELMANSLLRAIQ